MPPVRRPEIAPEVALRWAGAVLVVLAAAFFVSTAISRGWIGPRIQLALATLGGAALIATGLDLHRRHGVDRRPWSLVLCNAGVVVLGLCAGAAHVWLGLVGVGVAVALIVGVLAVALGLAEWLKSPSLAVSGLAVALIMPGVIGAYNEFGDVGTGAWMLVLVAVTMALAAWHHWAVPRLLGLVVVGPLMVLLTSGLVDPPGSDQLVIQLMVAVGGLAWWMAPWIRPAVRPLDMLDQRLVMVVPGLVWLASSGLWVTTDRGRAVVAVVAAVAFGIGGGLIWSQRAAGDPQARAIRPLLFSQIVGVSSLISVALALWFDGPVLLVALTVQALGVAILTLRANDPLLDLNAALLWAVVGLWTGSGLLEGVEGGLEAAEGVAYAAALAAAGAVAWLIRQRSLQLAGLTAVAVWAGLLAWVMAVLRPLPQGQMLVSITWAVLGTLMVVVGLGVIQSDLSVWSEVRRRRSEIKTLGLTTLAATVIKLITVDLAEVDTIWRALLFAVVGVGLLRLGYSIGVLERRDDGTPPAEPEPPSRVT